MSLRPSTAEFASYYARYIDRVPTEDFRTQLAAALLTIPDYLRTLSSEQWNHRYAPEKWTAKESWIHLMDTERIMSTRALRIGRGDTTPLPGFNQDEYVPYSEANDRSGASVIEEYLAVRQATIVLFGSMSATALARSGQASGQPVSVRALGFIIAGHELHHLALLQERYFPHL